MKFWNSCEKGDYLDVRYVWSKIGLSVPNSWKKRLKLGINVTIWCEFDGFIYKNLNIHMTNLSTTKIPMPSCNAKTHSDIFVSLVLLYIDQTLCT